jgi:hypothetical protein
VDGCVADGFGFTGFFEEEPGATLFPGPAPARLVSTVFFGGTSTALLLASGRTNATVSRDFYNRLSTWVLLCGHGLHAVRLVLHGQWSSKQAVAFRDSMSAILVAERVMIVEPLLRDASASERTASALVWALKGEGAPLAGAEVEDKVIVAADIAPDGAKHPPVFAGWGDRVKKLWTEKYPNRKGVVRFAFPVAGVDAARLRVALAELEPALRFDAEYREIEKVRGGAGVAVVVSPHFAAATARRIVHLRKAATVVVAGAFEPMEGRK